jgi:hypothetical protein
VGLHRYRVIVCGRLGEISRGVFEDLRVEPDGGNTRLTGELDQAALYGVLDRIQALGLELVALNRLDDEQAETGRDAASRGTGY